MKSIITKNYWAEISETTASIWWTYNCSAVRWKVPEFWPNDSEEVIMIFVSNLACCNIWRWWFANVFDIGFFVGGSCGFEIFEQQSENWWSFSITHCAFPNGEINGIPVINSLELWAHIQWSLSFQSAKKGDIPVILTELSPRFPKVMPSHSFNQLTFAFTLINLHSRRNRFYHVHAHLLKRWVVWSNIELQH